MENVTQNAKINIDEILKNGKKIVTTKDTPKEVDAVVVDDDDLIIDDDQTLAATPVTPAEEYTGLGAVVDKAELDASKAKKANGNIVVDRVKEETMDSVKSYMGEQDKDIAAAKAKAEAMKKAGIKPKVDPAHASIVNIYLDKANVGKLEFTPEQQKRIEMASKIVINEETQVNFKSLKLNRLEALSVDEAKQKRARILEKAFDRTMSPFIALGSGYMGKMCNCSTAEVMKLARSIDSGKNLNSEIERWTLLYNKMKQCSLGKFPDFDTFLKETAYDDYDNLQYALICASFPETTTIKFTCNKCHKEFTQTIKNKELLRTDMVDEKMASYVEQIINGAPILEEAQRVHKDAPFNVITRLNLNDDSNDVYLDLYSPSAYDAIYRTYKELDSKYANDPDYSGFMEMIKMIKSANVYDFEKADGSYIVCDEPDDIIQILHMFTEKQINKLATYISESYLVHKYQYGFKEVICPNPDCKNNMGAYQMDMDSLLFLKVRQQ
jgi:hypothetical protein